MKEATLRDMFESHRGRQIDKWQHYFDIYEKHFERFRNTFVRVLEIGIDHGGSLQLWKRYFGPASQIVGVDVDRTTLFAEANILTYAMDQTDPKIADLRESWDIIIDDGSHNPEHQVITFEHLWPKLSAGGVYLIEDCHGVYPAVRCVGGLKYQYPWVLVYERPRRLIRGTPARELRPDEAEARKFYGP